MPALILCAGGAVAKSSVAIWRYALAALIFSLIKIISLLLISSPSLIGRWPFLLQRDQVVRIVEPENEAEIAVPVTATEESDFALEEPAAETPTPPEAQEEDEIATPAVNEALEELSQEVRRVGRELFKTNRAAERNQEMFEAALAELQAVGAALAHLPAQAAESVFQAKATLCRELLRVADALEASLMAATQVLARLEANAQQPAQGIVFRFQTARQMRTALDDSVAAMRGWHDGQQLLYERLLAVLNAAGVRSIEVAGRPFDSTLHRAVAVEQRSDVPAGTIVGEELKGYTLEGRILRYPEVVVAKSEGSGAGRRDEPQMSADERG